MSNLQRETLPGHRPRPIVDMMVSIIIPSIILMRFSGDEGLGVTGGLVAALAFPLGWGTFELVKYKKFNIISILGLISVLLTGGIGLFKLDPQWLAVKEAAIPGIIGLAIFLSTFTRYPLIRTLIYNPSLMNVEKIKQVLLERGNNEAFEARLLNVTYLLCGTFFFSSIMNYILAKWIVNSPSGSVAFNEELGQLALLSYPVIAIPSMLMMTGILYYLWRTINGMTGLSIEEILVSNKSDNKSSS